MNRPRSTQLASALALGAALLTLVPYVIAWRVAPAGSIFSGFLVNPLDGFSYLAKMQQGLRGSWLFELPYAVQPGPPALIFTFYLALGQLTRLLGAAPIWVFHAARLLAIVLMGLAAFSFLRAVLPPGRSLWASYLIFLFASGFGWLAGPLGLLTSDLLIPESVPLFASLVNPHFPLALAGVAAGAALLVRGGAGWPSRALALALGFGLALVLPFALVTLLAALLGWQLVEAWLRRRDLGVFLSRGWGAQLALLAALALGGGPLLLYDLLLTRRHPVLIAWNAQNLTPSPPLPSYLLGFGLPLLLALFSAFRRRVWRESTGRLLLVWLLINFLLLYAPFNLQRRLALGLFLPLAALAGQGFGALVEDRPTVRWLPLLLIVLMLPSNALTMLAGVSQVTQGDPKLLLTGPELEGYRWLGDHLRGRPIALAAPLTGNRLPAYAPVRVLYGHPYETPRAETRRRQVVAFYEQGGGAVEIRERAAALGADLIVFGPHEAAFGEPVGLAELPLLYANDGFSVYRVAAP